MTVLQYSAVPAGFKRPAPKSFIAADTTLVKVLVDATPPAAAVANVSPLFYGGCSVIDLTATSSDTASKDLILYTGQVISTVGAGTGAVTTTTNTIVRAAGSWITDGWKAGDLIAAFAPVLSAPNTGIDGIVCTITAVTATTITVNGTPIAAASIAAGGRLCQVTPLFRQAVAALAGTNGLVASQNLLASDYDGVVGRTEIKLGPTDLLLGGMATAVAALPAYVSVNCGVALY